MFDSTNFKGLGLPPFTIKPGEIVRIEAKSGDQAKNLHKKLVELNFTKVNVSKKLYKGSVFSNPSVLDFLTRNSRLSDAQISSFCELTGILSHEKLSRLTEGQINTVVMVTLSDINELLLLSTIGMYVSCLEVCYDVLRKVLNRGGACLEVTYPPYGGDYLDKMISPELIDMGSSEDSLSRTMGSKLKVIQV